MGWGSLEGTPMPDYANILSFLANNPPQMDAERNLHASLLELLANSLRDGQPGTELPTPAHVEPILRRTVSPTSIN